MKRAYFLLFLLGLSLCSYQAKQTLEVTFKNATNQDFKKLEVNIRGHVYTFSNLKKGRLSKPIAVESAYKYCYAKAYTVTDTLVCQPEDFVGEVLVTEGKLMMVLQLQSGKKGEKNLIITN